MKKLFWLLVSLLVIGTALVYVYIPRNITVSRSGNINANQDGVFRYLRTDSNWQSWWPGEIEKQGGTTLLFIDDYCISLEEVLYKSFKFKIKKGRNIFDGNLYIIPLRVDASQILWNSKIMSGKDPVNKIERYFLMKNLGKAFEKVINRMEDHLSKTANIYGLDIQAEKVQIQHLVSTKKSFAHVPGTADIYRMISQVRNYIAETGAREQAEPMLNISTKDSIDFQTQVGIPVDKALPGNNVIVPKMMLKGGNILVSEVQGDMNVTNWGFQKMEEYISDHERTVIALPFQVLVTDRNKEPDSTKWITRLYYPVM